MYRLKKTKDKRQEDSGTEDNDEYPISKYASRQVFSGHEEELVGYLQKCANLHYGLTYRHIRIFAYQYAVLNKKNMPESWHENIMAGEEWMGSFMKRHRKKISLRKPENTSIARIKGFNKNSVMAFYKNLELNTNLTHQEFIT